MTNASATKPRNSRARITAIATDSTVSRQPPSGGGVSLLVAEDFFTSRSVFNLFMLPWRRQLACHLRLFNVTAGKLPASLHCNSLADGIYRNARAANTLNRDDPRPIPPSPLPHIRPQPRLNPPRDNRPNF